MCFLCCFYFKKILIENSFSFVEKLNFSFVLPSDVWLISAHHHGRILGGGGGGGGGGVNLGSVSSHDAYKMDFLDAFLPRNYFLFYRNNIVFGIKL